ncbi:RHS repeat-associated core domain-containing protein [Pseudomonas mosselii]|uniref:RHS repeat-associated core domain-containing protein n=1 Tax=Pseudomonas mosselii TaxID=78327 RepID=UPI0009EBEB50|nr:RHS repeat-associated core domain-containing protein [Pseudomonas mosselii]MDH1529549.1 RHS repeat-associated core domain-containing protein [Pseudomonas mosselii]
MPYWISCLAGRVDTLLKIRRFICLSPSDRQRSILFTSSASYSYAPFGSRGQQATAHRLGYTGTLSEAFTEHYLLGNGYRGFNPLLMRFNSPDSWSPFGKAGVNAYAYCLNDPMNASDPSGHIKHSTGWGRLRQSLKFSLGAWHLQQRPDTLASRAVRVLEKQGRILPAESAQMVAGDISGAGTVYSHIGSRPPSFSAYSYQPVLRRGVSDPLDVRNMTRLYPAELGQYVKTVPGARERISIYSKGQAELYLRTVHANPDDFEPNLLQGMLPEHLAAADNALLMDDMAVDLSRVLSVFRGASG